MGCFSTEALLAERERVRDEGVPLFVWRQAGQWQLDVEVEELFGRGERASFRDAVHFWLVALDYATHYCEMPLPDTEDFFAYWLHDPYAFCQDLSLERFAQIVQGDADAWDDGPTFHGQFKHAWLIYHSRTNIVVLAETDEEFILFAREEVDEQ